MDDLIERCGSFGLYQKCLLGLIGSITALCGFTQFSSVFNNAIPKLYCRQKNSTENYLSNTCEIFSNITLSKANNMDSPYQCQYDTKYYEKTIVNEWDLVCDKTSLVNLTQTIFMIGALSSFCTGYLSDRFGRRTVCFYAALFLSFNMIICELLQLDYFDFSNESSYLIYAIVQYISGVTVYTLDLVTFVLLIECTTSKHSSFISIFNIVLYAVGELVLLVVSFYFRNWRIHNQFSAVFALLASLTVIFILNESPRYLLVKSRFEEATNVLVRIAKYNGNSDKISKEEIFDELNKIIEDKDEVKKLLESTHSISRSHNNISKSRRNPHNTAIEEEINKAPTIRQYLLSSKKNIITVSCFAYVCISVAMTYFGTTIGITSIGENYNPYIMFLVSCVTEICGYLIPIFGGKYSDRNRLCLALLISGFSSLVTAIIPVDATPDLTFNKISTVFFAGMGKMFISTSLYLLYVYPTKIFPTSVRNTLVSYILCSGRLGAIIAPQVNLLRIVVWEPLPYYIFGLNTIFASSLLLFLPNEKNIKHSI